MKLRHGLISKGLSNMMFIRRHAKVTLGMVTLIQKLVTINGLMGLGATVATPQLST